MNDSIYLEALDSGDRVARYWCPFGEHGWTMLIRRNVSRSPDEDRVILVCPECATAPPDLPKLQVRFMNDQISAEEARAIFKRSEFRLTKHKEGSPFWVKEVELTGIEMFHDGCAIQGLSGRTQDVRRDRRVFRWMTF